METLESALIPSFRRPPSQVAIRRADSYELDLFKLVYETLSEFQKRAKNEKASGTIAPSVPFPDMSGKTVLLKPNFVGFDPLGVMNTHPAVVAAVRESFLKLGASAVLIGD